MNTITWLDRLAKKSKKIEKVSSPFINMKQVASIILGGGEGTRLFPLTLTRCKPAVNFGGKYRLIDVPISLSLHADCYKIFVLTQFLSSSLHHHIFQTYLQGGKSSSLVEILTAEQKPTHKSWFQGTADAVRQNLDYLLENPVDYFLVLSGDQLYNLDFRKLVQFGKETDADLVIASLPVTAEDASRMGILKVNSEHLVTDFYEKPKDPAILQRFSCPPEILEHSGISPLSTKRHYLGSMGIYLFKRECLAELLLQDLREDFGKHLIPTKVQSGKVAAFLYDDYWEDIGTISTFYQANMALTEENSVFNFYNENRPIFSWRYDLPPAKFFHTHFKQTILCEGAIIEADEVTHSILGPRSVIKKGSIIRDSYLMGNDYYKSTDHHHKLPPFPHIGEHCIIQNAIIDKNVCIGNGVKLINKQKLTHYDSENIYIRDGVIIVPRGANLPDGFTL